MFINLERVSRGERVRYQEDSDDEFFLSQMQPEVQLRVGDAARLFVERVEIKLEPGSSRFVFLRLSTPFKKCK